MQAEAPLLQQHFGQQQAERQAERQAEQPWQHEAVVEDVAAYARGARGVEVDGRDDGDLVRNEEVAIDGHKGAHHDFRRHAQAHAHGKQRGDCGALAIDQHGKNEKRESEGPRRAFHQP